jgi:hypothetical protein
MGAAADTPLWQALRPLLISLRVQSCFLLVPDTRGRGIRAVTYQCIGGKHVSVFAESESNARLQSRILRRQELRLHTTTGGFLHRRTMEIHSARLVTDNAMSSAPTSALPSVDRRDFRVTAGCSANAKTFAACVTRWEAFRCSDISARCIVRPGRGEMRWIDTPASAQKTKAIAIASNVLQNLGPFPKIFIACRTVGPTSGISALGCKGNCFRTALSGTTFGEVNATA